MKTRHVQFQKFEISEFKQNRSCAILSAAHKAIRAQFMASAMDIDYTFNCKLHFSALPLSHLTESFRNEFFGFNSIYFSHYFKSLFYVGEKARKRNSEGNRI